MYTKLTNSSTSFAERMKRFGVVTVMDADVYDVGNYTDLKERTAYKILAAAKKAKNAKDGKSTKETDGVDLTYLCTLDSLKTADVSADGPTKTVTGGKYNNTLLKYGKTRTISRQDALGNHKALEALCGTVSEYNAENANGVTDDSLVGRHNVADFASAKMIVGDSFFIDQKTGQSIPVKIRFYQFLPDSLFNLTQEADGDATVFDRNGSLLATEIAVGHSDGTKSVEGVFWSVITPDDIDEKWSGGSTGDSGASGATSSTQP